MSAPMTAQEAADAFNRWAHLPFDAQHAQTRDWFARNWPAGGAVPFDVEAVEEAMWQAIYAAGAVLGQSRDAIRNAVTPLLRRHAAAPATGVGVVRASTDGVGFSPKSYRIFCDALALFEKSVDDGDEGEDRVEAHDRVVDAARQCIADSVAQQLALRARAGTAQVVEVTNEEMYKAAMGGTDISWERCGLEARATWKRYADKLNASVRARAGTAGQTTGAQWVRRPEGQASALVVPEDGRYAIKFAGPSPEKIDVAGYKTGMKIGENVTAIRRIDTDAPTTWIERTPATAGGWTDLDVAACVGQHVVEQYDGTYSETQKWADDVDARCIATTYDATGVVAYYILPPVEAQP
jgi:hypothetical protein